MQEMIIRKMQSFIPCRSDVNYFLIHLENKTLQRLGIDLAEKGVLVRDCSTFTGMGVKYVRVAVKTHKENLVLLDALESIDN